MEQARISSPQGTQAPQTARSRQGSDAAGAAASPGSFLALLSAQDDVAVQGGMLGDVMERAANSGTDIGDMASDAAPYAADASVVVAWQGLVAQDATVGSADASAVVAWQGLVAPDATALPQTSGQGGDAWSGSSGDSGWTGTLVVGGDGLRQGLVAETAVLDGAADLKEAGLQGPVAGYGRILSRMQAALAQRGANAGSGGLVDGSVGRSGIGAASQHPAMASHVLATAFQNGSESAAVIASQSPGVHAERNGGLVSTAFTSESSPAGAGGMTALAVSVRGGDTPGGGRPGEGPSGGTAWSDGSVGATQLETGGVDGPSMFADPTQVGGEEHITEQVAYWVNQKTQNAELTLDRDGQPVEVSVSLSGNEAHVTFRSDQPEARELLDRSMAQLSDLLRSEGLVLSGMSVGSSVRDGTGAGDTGQSRNREGARQAQVVSSAPVGAAAERRSGGVTDRTVDIFV